MSWLILIVSGLLEAVWAAALAASNGFRKWRPTVLFAVSSTLSMAGLAFAMRDIPTGTAYAVWVGIGAALTTAWAMISGVDARDGRRIALLVLLVACVVGLKVVS